MRKTITIVLIIVMALTILAGCSTTNKTTKISGASSGTTSSAATTSGSTTATTVGTTKITVGYSNLADSDLFCKYTKDIFIELCKTDPNIEVIATDANVDVQKQLDQIDNFIAQEVNCIMVVPVDAEGIVPGIKKANEAGIPVLAFLASAPEGDYTFIGSDSNVAGQMQGALLKTMLPENAKIVYLQGTPGLTHSTQRWNGFKKACLDVRSDIDLLASQTANYNRDEGMKVMEDWIQAFPHIDAVIAANDQMALGAIQALKTANRLDGVLVTGIDGTYDACVAIQAGEMTQSVFQNGKAQATKCFELIQKMSQGTPLPGGNVFVDYDSITKDNVQSYLDDYKARGYGK